jgi:DTW domain-containing protein YfiP
MTMKRAQCATCQRAASACICQWIRRVDSRTALLILQHPMETANAKNSARLLHLCLPGSTLAVGETFDNLAQLLARLPTQLPDSLPDSLPERRRRPVLLYPDTPGDRSLGIAPPPPFEPLAAEQVLLVVLDATWRKSRKMLYLNPALQALPRLALRDVPASHYLIRKAQAPGQLSTLEATAYALAGLEREGGRGDARFEASRYAPLIEAFDGFVGQQRALADGGGTRGPKPIS